MKRLLRQFLPAFILMFVGTAVSLGSEDIDNFYYARCNLKILKGTLITWVNWQASPEFLPAGSKVTLSLKGRKATLTDVETNRNFTLDMGAAGPQFLSKFFVTEPVSIQRYSDDVKASIRNAVARAGMTKLQAYVAMGPPAWIPSGNTNTSAYEQIMAADQWVYKRRRFGKNIGIKFDPQTGLVIQTEGIWR